MPDPGHPHDYRNAPGQPPRDWNEALSALPLDTPDTDGWVRLAAQLPIRGDATTTNTADRATRSSMPRRRRPLVWLAAAAALATMALIPMQWLRQTPQANTAPVASTGLERLHAESARLEALVAMARDSRMASAQATLLTASLDARITRIDAALARPGLEHAQQMRLWQSRVEALRELAGVETTQRWLSVHGERWDTALVQVD